MGVCGGLNEAWVSPYLHRYELGIVPPLKAVAVSTTGVKGRAALNRRPSADYEGMEVVKP